MYSVALGHTGSLIFIVAHVISSCDMQTFSFHTWDIVPWPGIEPGTPPHWERGILAPRPPGNRTKPVFLTREPWTLSNSSHELWAWGMRVGMV